MGVQIISDTGTRGVRDTCSRSSDCTNWNQVKVDQTVRLAVINHAWHVSWNCQRWSVEYMQ